MAVPSKRLIRTSLVVLKNPLRFTFIFKSLNMSVKMAPRKNKQEDFVSLASLFVFQTTRLVFLRRLSTNRQR